MNSKSFRWVGVVAAATALLLSACGGADVPGTDTPTANAKTVTTKTVDATTEAEPSETPTTTEKPEPAAPMDRMITAHCHSSDDPGVDMVFRSLADAWESSPDLRERCDVTIPSVDELHEKEVEALDTAYNGDSDGLETLYSLCAETMLGDVDGHMPYSEGQREEVEGALTLCPDHTDAEEIRSRMAEAEAEGALEDEGRLFYDGTYRVGEDVQPGAYVHESDVDPVENCYWELLDEQGNIVDSNFISSAFRVEIRVTESAYSLSTDGCGKFVPVE